MWTEGLVSHIVSLVQAMREEARATSVLPALPEVDGRPFPFLFDFVWDEFLGVNAPYPKSAAARSR